MTTENPKISAYVPPIVYQRLKEYQDECGTTMSQAVVHLLCVYFGIDLIELTVSSGGLEGRLKELEARLGAIEIELAEMRNNQQQPQEKSPPPLKDFFSNAYEKHYNRKEKNGK
jgi:hypothetical protein